MVKSVVVLRHSLVMVRCVNYVEFDTEKLGKLVVYEYRKTLTLLTLDCA